MVRSEKSESKSEAKTEAKSEARSEAKSEVLPGWSKLFLEPCWPDEDFSMEQWRDKVRRVSVLIRRLGRLVKLSSARGAPKSPLAKPPIA